MIFIMIFSGRWCSDHAVTFYQDLKSSINVPREHVGTCPTGIITVKLYIYNNITVIKKKCNK